MFKKLKFITLLLALAIPFCAVGCSNGDENKNDTPTVTPTMSSKEIHLQVGETFTLSVNDYDGTVEWGVSNGSIVSVNNGVVNALAVGETFVTAIVGEQVLTCKVVCTINYVEIPQLVLKGEIKGENGYVITLQVGGEYELTPALMKENKALSGVVISVAVSGDAVIVDGFIVKGVSLTEGTVVTLSCEYENKTYQETLTVVVK